LLFCYSGQAGALAGGFSAFVSYHLNKLPPNSNKPLVAALFVLLYDVALNNALTYAVGAQAAVLGPQRGAWRLGVLPNRAGVAPTVVVIFLPGAPGIGKTTAVRCACAPRPRVSRARRGAPR
jgi:hypothetical protein